VVDAAEHQVDAAEHQVDAAGLDAVGCCVRPVPPSSAPAGVEWRVEAGRPPWHPERPDLAIHAWPDLRQHVTARTLAIGATSP